MGFLLVFRYSLSWPGTQRCVCLLFFSAGIKGVPHHAWLMKDHAGFLLFFLPLSLAETVFYCTAQADRQFLAPHLPQALLLGGQVDTKAQLRREVSVGLRS